MRKLLLLITAVVFATGCPSTSQNVPPVGGIAETPHMSPTYKVYVKGLVCPSCAVGLKKGLMKLPFVKLIHVNYKTGIVLVYEKRQRDKGGEELDKSRITKAVEDSGYEVDKFMED